MSSFYRDLPSFATDYSGFISLMHGLGGLMIVHDPSGCLGNYTNTDEPRWYHDPQPVFSTLMRELEAVIGDTTGTIEKIKKEIETRKPPFVCVLGTPIPALTGCDTVLLAEELQAETGVPCFGIETNGFKFYNDGITRALDLLYENFMEPAKAQVSNKVNILGMTPLDFSIYGEKENLISHLGNEGFQVGAFLGMGDSLDDIRNAKSAKLNIVMSSAAIPLAKKMKEQDGIEYRLGPICTKKAVEKLVKGAEYNKVLIVGEQLCGNALRKGLKEINPKAGITVGTFFEFSEEVSEPADVKIRDEKALKKLISDGDFDTVIADPLIEQFCTKSQHFIKDVHPAFSSKICWQDTLIYNI